jgi:hypothetical protein
MDTIPSSLVRDRIGNRLHTCVCIVYTRAVYGLIDLFILEVLRNMALPLLFSHTEVDSTVAIVSASIVAPTVMGPGTHGQKGSQRIKFTSSDTRQTIQ